MELEELNKNRAIIRSSVTTEFKNIDKYIEKDNKDELDYCLELLSIKENELKCLDEKIQILIEDDLQLDLDFEESMDYIDKITVVKARIKRFIKKFYSLNINNGAPNRNRYNLTDGPNSSDLKKDTSRPCLAPKKNLTSSALEFIETSFDDNTSLTFNVIVEEKLISEHVTKVCDLEASGLIDDKKDLDPTENENLKHFESNIEYENKRYEVRLPWKLDAQELNDNRKINEMRFIQLGKQFQKNPDLFLEYREVLQNYWKQDIIELDQNSESYSIVSFYLPPREEIRKDRTTSQLRIVYDGSSHDANFPSLSSCLYLELNPYPDIFDILLWLRLVAVAFTTDMKEAFSEIMLNERHGDVTRFLFKEDPPDESQSPSVHRFTRDLFGISSTAFLLAATTKHPFEKFHEKYRNTVEFLKENIYVDDITGRESSLDEALNDFVESAKIFEDASITLLKWRTNFKSLHIAWIEESIISDENPRFDTLGKENLPLKILDIVWNCGEVHLDLDIKGLIDFVSNRTDTKRFISQVLDRIFDPIDFLGLFILILKYLMLKIWLLGEEWHDTLPDDITTRGEKISKLIDDTTSLHDPKWLRLPTEFLPESSNEPHGGEDVSNKRRVKGLLVRTTQHLYPIEL